MTIPSNATSEHAETEDALRQSEDRFRLLVQSVRDYAIFMLNPEGRVMTWNPGAQLIKGYSAEEILGQHFSRFYLPVEARSGKCDRELEQAIREGSFEEEGWRLRKDGSRFWASVVIHPVRRQDGALVGFSKVTRDLTDRLRAESERLRLVQAEEAVRLRDEFLSIASHELRTPLTAIQLQLESLLEDPKALEEKSRRKVQRAYRGGERLSDLIGALLDVSRIASGRLSLERSRFDLGEVAAEVIDRFRPQTERVGCLLTLRQEGDLNLYGDPLRIEQLLTNIIGNALKYAAGSPIEVELCAGSDTIRVAISDGGPGIPRSEWSRIFGRFERASSMRHFGGLGLGLYVAEQIAVAHGGGILIEAVEPHGAKFVVTLPRNSKIEAYDSAQSDGGGG